MTIQEFNLLTQSQKEDIIHQESEFLHVEKEDELCFGLYAKDTFFIELICYDRDLSIKGINTFDEGALLHKYYHLIRDSFPLREN